MRQSTNYILIGSFVIVASVLGVGTAILLGIGSFGSDHRILETYIRESVQGLEVGAHVRFRGVKIGQVTEITFTTEEYDSEEPYPLVRFKVRPPRHMSMQDIDDVIDDRLNAGLRAQLASQGLTGALYLEADLYENAEELHPPIDHDWIPRYRYIPSIPSRITQISDSIANVLAELDASEIAGLVTDARASITSVRRAVDGFDTAAISENFTQVTTAATETLRDIDTAVARIDTRTGELLGDLRERVRSLDPEVLGEMMEDLRVFTRELEPVPGTVRDTIAEAQRTVRSLSSIFRGRARETDEVLANVRRISASLANLADTLESYPSLLLLGNPPPRRTR